MQSKRSRIAAFLIGLGMGGFVDGIVLHQILQWHNMVSNWLPPTTMDAMRINMVWDGIFHAFVWLTTFAGILLLWKAAYEGETIPSLRAFAGQMLLGWGMFNLVEGIVDHQILQIHFVRQVPEYQVYNLTFLAVGGVIFTVIGWLLSSRNSSNHPSVKQKNRWHCKFEGSFGEFQLYTQGAIIDFTSTQVRKIRKESQ